MTTLTSPTNESYSVAYSNPARLEISGMEGTPQGSTVDHQHLLVQFEQYVDERSNYPGQESKHKNPLVITVEDSFDCKMMDAPGIRNNKRQQSAFQSAECKEEEVSLLIEYREKIQELTTKNLQLQEKVFYFQDYNGKLVNQVQALREQGEDYIMKHQHFKQMIWKKDQQLMVQKEVIESLNLKMGDIQKDCYNAKFFQEKAKEKDIRVRELIKKIDKLIVINKSLQVEVKQSNDKLVTLEREVQMNAYNQILENRVKLKQSISTVNKQNIDDNFRKSFETGQQRRSRLSNISVFEKKAKSNSNVGRLKH